MRTQDRSIVMLTPDRQIDRRILLEADALQNAGWQVQIIAMPLDTEAEDDPRVLRIGTQVPGARRENMVLDCYRWVRRHVPMNGSLMRALKMAAWRYVVDPESFYTKLFADTVFQVTPAVFVAHDLPMLPVAAKAAARCGAKLVYDSHELYCEQEFTVRERRRWAEIEAKYIGACDAVIAVNHSVADEITRRYRVPHVNVIMNAARPRRSPVKERRFHRTFGLRDDDKVLLYQGGLSAGRNIEALVASIAELRNAAVHLVVMGDGMLRKKLESLAHRERVEYKVHFHAAVQQHELLDYSASADAGVIPYLATCLNNRYCTPNKLFEFIAAGLPVLASDLPELRRIVCEHGIGIGTVGDMSSPTRIAALIDRFFSDPGRLEGWRLNVEHARHSLSWDKEAEKLVKIFEALQ